LRLRDVEWHQWKRVVRQLGWHTGETAESRAGHAHNQALDWQRRTHDVRVGAAQHRALLERRAFGKLNADDEANRAVGNAQRH
jgi:hypothetical protein